MEDKITDEALIKILIPIANLTYNETFIDLTQVLLKIIERNENAKN